MDSSTSAKPKPRGILKNPLNPEGSSERPHKLKWDEDNLLLTEAQKDSTMKIDEPKTPYVRYDHENDIVLSDLDSIPDMSLSGSATIPPLDIESPSRGAHVVEENDWSEDEEEELDEEAKEKHERFLKMRAQHYHMGDALKHPVDVDDDESPDMEMDEDH
ncbi:hypothetical protein K493DRAFT_300124 [Basidiobolus meristosporus CBS 931.73]|uniref:Protein phosphatase inhibitor 2 n=1 Tax=Basidiobolus meristosporus CBS 931.73 TaxID=1314790 RepID=A0A1Y1YJC8_9FUNG|nr:hypothetical protein K493DRAFT_300124 [Basidiobolus meristosporus CBS 931.73]|eukprot:ORX98058.1 hypothetical protein K493DRAFT_300124 [Basidiobolus meristosporus CBS 931.73]